MLAPRRCALTQSAASVTSFTGRARGEGRTANGTAHGLSDSDMQMMSAYNLPIAQLYCYLPTAPILDNATLDSITTAMQVWPQMISLERCQSTASSGRQ